MKKFKIFGFSNGNPILITNSEKISPAATFDENFSIQEHMKSTLSFKIVDTLENKKPNDYMDLIYLGAKIRLFLESDSVNFPDLTYEFVITSITNEFFKDLIIYNVSSEDLASNTYSKVGVGLSLDKTGTLKEIAQEILAQTRVNPGYIEASYNFIDTSRFKDILNSTIVDGIFKTIALEENKPSAIFFNRDKNLKTGQDYILSFNVTNNLSDGSEEGIETLFSITEYNMYGIQIGEPVLSPFVLGLYQLDYTPTETMSYFKVEFLSTDENKLVIADFKLNKKLDQQLIENYIHIDPNFNEGEFKNEDQIFEKYSYFKKVTLRIDNSNLYNALIELCKLFDAYLEINYKTDEKNTFNFVPRKSSKYKGYRLSPTFNLLSINRSEDFSEFITSLRIKGSTENTSIFPDMPREFLDYFNRCIEESLNEPVDSFAQGFFDTYGSEEGQLTYTSIADTILEALEEQSEADRLEREDILYAYAYSCDKVPNFENVIYNINYFQKIGKISNEAYNDFKEKILNNLRVLNIKLKVYSDRYFNILSDLSLIEEKVNFNSQAITVESLSKYEIENILNETFEYNRIDTEIVGDNLLRNPSFSSYGTDNTDLNTFNIPTFWTMTSAALLRGTFNINTSFLTDLNNLSIKFEDYASPSYLNASDLSIFLENFSRIELRPEDSNKPITVSAFVYLDNNFSGYFPRFILSYISSTGTITTQSTTTSNFTNLFSSGALIKNRWIRISHTFPAPGNASFLNLSLSVHVPGTRAQANSVFYYAQPQLELRSQATDWSAQIIAREGTTGINLLSGTTFENQPGTLPPGWASSTSRVFSVSSDIKNDNKNSLKLNWSAGLENLAFVLSNRIDLRAYPVQNRNFSLSGFVYRNNDKTLSLPIYFSLLYRDKNNTIIGEGNKELLISDNIGQSNVWIPFRRTFTIPADIKYIQLKIGYHKTSASEKGSDTDEIFLSLVQLEFGLRATPWTPVYDIDGQRYATYQFIKPDHQFKDDDLVVLDYETEDSYDSNKNKYPTPKGSYFIVQSAQNIFKISNTRGGTPIQYNEEYVGDGSLWKLSRTGFQERTENWITLKNLIADREDRIQELKLQIYNELGIVYNDFFEPVRLQLENNNISNLRIGSFIDKLFTNYGYENINRNGLQDEINKTIEEIENEYNDYLFNKRQILSLVEFLNQENIFPGERLLKETDKAGYETLNSNKKFTIGIFTTERKILDNQQRTILAYVPPSAENTMQKIVEIPLIFDIANQNFTGKYVRIDSLDGQETYLKYILNHETGSNNLLIEYYPKRNKAYNIFIVDIEENIDKPVVKGSLQNKLDFYNLLKQFISSYTFSKSFIDYSVWSQFYTGEDRAARITDKWDFTGSALITFEDYGNGYFDYMVRLSSNSVLIAPFTVTESSKSFDVKTLFKTKNNVDLPPTGSFLLRIKNSSGNIVDSFSAFFLNQNWTVLKNEDPIPLAPGNYTVEFVNQSTYNALVYSPVVIYSGTLLADEELLALYDNPQTTNYIETINIEIPLIIGLYDIVINQNYELNLARKKNEFLSELYRDYKKYIYEGYYENSDEIDSFGLLEQSLIASEKYRIPKIQYSTSIIDISSLQDYRNLNIMIGDKIIIAEKEDRLYKSYSEEENKYLVITNLSYNLRNIGSTALTIDRDDETESLIQRIIKSIE